MSYTHLIDRRPRARKRFNCCLCGRSIFASTIHVARQGIVNGNIVTQRMHDDCERITREWPKDGWEEDVYNSDPCEFMREKMKFYKD